MAANGKDDNVTRERGNSTYSGPATGLDLTGSTFDQRNVKMALKDYQRKVIDAAEKDEIGGEPLDNEDAEIVAEHADLHRLEVLRIWRDADLEVDVNYQTKLDWDDLNEEYREALAYLYHNEAVGTKQVNTLGYSDVADRVGLSSSSVKRASNEYSWLLKDSYRPDWVDEQASKYTLEASDSERRGGGNLDEGFAQYESLSDRQQAFVDAVAELQIDNGDIAPSDVIRGMRERNVQPYTGGTIENYFREYEDVIEYKIHARTNDRGEFEGKEGVDDEFDISDAVAQLNGDADDVEEADDATTSVTLDLTEKQLFDLLRSEQEDIAWEVFQQIK